MFISFEGIEGSGKTTQIQLLANALQSKGKKVLLTREPGGTKISDQIRKILLDAENKNMVPNCELLLYYAARAQHLEKQILPSLKAGMIVLCDRFVDATIAYQGFARGLDHKVLDDLERSFVFRIYITGGEPTLNPNLEFILRTAYSKGVKTVVNSNGIHIPGEVYSALVETESRLSLSLDSYVRERHDQKRKQRSY